MKNGIRCFYADFIGDKVHICGKVFPTGSFALMLLEEGYKNDALLHITPFIRNIEKVLDALNAGYTDSEVLENAGRDIHIMLDALQKLSPYRWFDTNGEKELVSAICCEESAKLIEEYFSQRAKLGALNRAELVVRNMLKLPNSPENMDGRKTLDELYDILRFYLRLATDFADANYDLRDFMRQQTLLEKYDEHSLIRLALSVFDRHDFDVHTEYIAIDSKVKGKKTLAKRLYFSSYYSFFITDFFEGLRCGHRPSQCQVCGRYYMPKTMRRQKYCSGYAPESITGQKKISCRKWAASKKSGLAKERAAADPIKACYTNRCSVIREYKSRGRIPDYFAEAAFRLARERRDRAIRDTEYANTRYYDDMSHESIMSDTMHRLRGTERNDKKIEC